MTKLRAAILVNLLEIQEYTARFTIFDKSDKGAEKRGNLYYVVVVI